MTCSSINFAVENAGQCWHIDSLIEAVFSSSPYPKGKCASTEDLSRKRIFCAQVPCFATAGRNAIYTSGSGENVNWGLVAEISLLAAKLAPVPRIGWRSLSTRRGRRIALELRDAEGPGKIGLERSLLKGRLAKVKGLRL